MYIDMAVNLARSFRWWHQKSSIQFFLATDQKDLIPNDLIGKIEIIEIEPGELGEGFSPKLHLDKLAPTAQTLFVDADCLCVGSLEPIFARFCGHSVSVIGKTITDGEWFGDVSAICSQFNVDGIPRFNGGVYYLEPGEIVSKVYQTARSLEPKYDEIGFKRLRNRPNDEVLMALAMAIHGQLSIPEDGTIMNSTLAAPAGLEIDVLKGKSRLFNPKDCPNHNSWYEQEEMNPLLVHFLGYQTNIHPYIREKIKLDLTVNKKIPASISSLLANFFSFYPWLIKDTFKNIFRPAYHQFFGFRKIRKAVGER